MSDLDIRLAEDHEQVARAGLLEQLVAHRQVGVHLGRQHHQLAVALGLFAHAGVKGEAADCEHVEADALDCLLGGLLDERRAHGPMLRSNADGDALFRAVFLGEFPLGVNPRVAHDLKAVEFQALAFHRVLNARLAQVVENRIREAVAGHDRRRETEPVRPLGQRLLLLDADRAMRRQAFHRERPAHTHALVVFVGLVVERFGLRVFGDGRVDLLPRHALCNVRVVSDGLERDVRHALVDEAAPDVATVWRASRVSGGSRRRFLPPLTREAR